MQIQTNIYDTARRQVEICNACRYCEGYCSVFPAIHRERAFSDADLTHFANLCHNCRGCYYACQYTEPHEFGLNIPGVFAEIRRKSWEEYAYPSWLAKLFQRNGVLITALAVFGIIAFFLSFTSSDGTQFYDVMSHDLMVAIFAPSFLLPLLSIAIGIRRYWKETAPGAFHLSDLMDAFRSAGRMKNLEGGHGDGCNFEEEDKFSHARKIAHHLVMYGFLLCFASTSVATLMHYVLNWPAPYGLLTPPKLLGIPGGIMLTIGAGWMFSLKLRAERKLGDSSAWGGESAFVLLLGAVAATGLALYAVTGTSWVPELLAIHLGTVLALFWLIPFSKMAHGFFRLTALTVEAQKKRLA